jgi:DNA-binding transcriptional LysR family regulator
MELIDLNYMEAAARWRSFSRAAEALGLATSTLSRRIGRLEDELGLALFERGRNGLRLTSAGVSVLVHARGALLELDAIKKIAQKRSRGELGEIRLGLGMAPLGEPISGLLAAWRAFEPKIAVTLIELNDRDHVAELEERRIDVILLPTYALWPHIAAYPIYRDRLVCVIRSGHRLENFHSCKWSDLSDEDILVRGRHGDSAHRDFLAERMGAGYTFIAHGVTEQSLFGLVASGFGVTISCEGHTKAMFPGAVWRPIDEPNAWVEHSLAWIPEIEDPAIGKFVAFMRDNR